MRQGQRLHGSLLLAVLITAACMPAAEVQDESAPSQIGELLRHWQPVMGEAGPRVADRLIETLTPPCYLPQSEERLDAWVARTRSTVGSALGLDLKRRVRSASVVREHRQPGYSVEVVRLEVFPGRYLAANVYAPTHVREGGGPLVVTPTGCRSSLWSPHVQQRAANLASLGMYVIATDGFCDNGERGELGEGNRNLGYARQLIGLPGTTAIYLQELVSLLSWAIERYPDVDPERIGAAGYSYGGGIAHLLAIVDTRIRSLSVPATLIGGACDQVPMHADRWIDSSPDHGPDHVWTEPIRLPLMPNNWRVAAIYPRHLHTTAGARDAGAAPATIGAAVSYAREVYEIGGYDHRILYLTDTDDHSYRRPRRQETYAWLDYSLNDAELGPRRESKVPILSREALLAGIEDSVALADELADRVAAEASRRFRDGRPTTLAAERAASAVRAGFRQPIGHVKANRETAWQLAVGEFRVSAETISGPHHRMAVFRFETAAAGPDHVLYLPASGGTRSELREILELVERYGRVTAVDYLGVGELRSARFREHSVARYLMHHRPSLPQLNVAQIHAVIRGSDEPFTMVYGNGWAASFLASALRVLEPERIGRVETAGVPADELAYLATGERIPDLLLQQDMFGMLTVSELLAAGQSAR